MILFKSAEIEISCAAASQFPASDCPEIAFVGRSNVGKSSLINKLLNRKKMARVSAVPGKTATANFYKVDELRFIDLPGYGYAKTSKKNISSWKKLIFDYLFDDRDLCLVVQLIDVRHSPTALDIQMTNLLIDGQIPFIIAFTKCDKLSEAQLKASQEQMKKAIPCFEDIISVLVSSQTGRGIEELASLIKEATA